MHVFCCSKQKPKNEAVVFDGGSEVDKHSELKKLTEAEQVEVLQRRLAALEKRSV